MNAPPVTTATSPESADPASHLQLLRLLEQRPQYSQRQLADALGLSLGKTHYVLHALLDRGLVKIGNFRRSGHKLAYAYLVTPSGLREKLRLTRSFLARKEAEFDQLQAVIADLRSELVQTDFPPSTDDKLRRSAAGARGRHA